MRELLADEPFMHFWKVKLARTATATQRGCPLKLDCVYKIVSQAC